MWNRIEMREEAERGEKEDWIEEEVEEMRTGLKRKKSREERDR